MRIPGQLVPNSLIQSHDQALSIETLSQADKRSDRGPRFPNVLFETNWAEDDEVKAETFIRQIIQSFEASMKMDGCRLHDEYRSETTDS